MSPSSHPVRPLRVDEVERMVAGGILAADERIELLGGVLVEVTPQGPVHATSVGLVAQRLRDAYGKGAHVREEKPLWGSPIDLPEPDVAVIRGSLTDYAARHPTGADALLVVEVAASSQLIDQHKAVTYAASAVPVYWLLDLAARTVSVHTDPTATGYREVTVCDEDASLQLPTLDRTLRVADLLVTVG